MLQTYAPLVLVVAKHLDLSLAHVWVVLQVVGRAEDHRDHELDLV